MRNDTLEACKPSTLYFLATLGTMTYQLTILAVKGLVCLTELIPPLMLTSLLTPSTCISLTRILPLPN